MKEPCLRNCKFKDNSICSLYEVKLKTDKLSDPYDSGYIEVYYKCEECLEKELSGQMDEKMMDIISFYRAFTTEMNLLLDEMNYLVEKRRSIYE